MSAPITEAHRKLAVELMLALPSQSAATASVRSAAQLIADSEARAVFKITDERDWLKAWQDQAETNYAIGEPLAKKLRDTIAERDQLRAELAAEWARLRQVALDAVKSAQIKPMVWYPKGYFVNPNDLGKINEQQVEACVAALDAAMKEDAK